MIRIAATIMMAASTKALTRASFNRLTPTALLGSLLGANGDKYAGAVMGTEDIMKPKAHGIVNGVHFFVKLRSRRWRRGAAAGRGARRRHPDAVAASGDARTRTRPTRAHRVRTQRRHVGHARPEGPALEL